MSGADGVPCRPLAWDSEFFGIAIAQVKSSILTRDEGARIREWARASAVDCLYLLADPRDDETIRVAEAESFRLVDVRVTLDIMLRAQGGEPAQPRSPRVTVRSSRTADLPGLREIAAVSHRDSRFYHDPHFPRERCDELYATWIEKSHEGFADAVLVAEIDERVAGYISCHVEGSAGRIGLLAVASAAQGSGAGSALIGASLDWFSTNSCQRVSVVTQGRNVRAQRVYQNLGFRTSRVELWYHKWPRDAAWGEA